MKHSAFAGLAIPIFDKMVFLLKNHAWKLSEKFASQQMFSYYQVSYIRWTLVGNKIVDHSDVVGASPVGAAPTTSSFST